jgi:hypothetical protein
MISIVCTYHNRKSQFITTLNTIKFQIENSDLEDVEVICVNHNSGEENNIDDLPKDFNFLKVINLNTDTKNPCIPYNVGFSNTVGDKIIIQNAECCHIGNIIQKTSERLNEDNYLSFACFSADIMTSNLIKSIIRPCNESSVEAIKNKVYSLPQTGPGFLSNSWYNHSRFSPRNLHFTTAITKNNLDKLKGFDERYAIGMDYDDDDFIMRVNRLNVEIVNIDDPFSVHLHHSSSYNNFVIDGKAYSPNDLRMINLNVFNKARGESLVTAEWNEFYD